MSQKFLVGDVVRHKASQRTAVIMRVHDECTNPDHIDKGFHCPATAGCNRQPIDVYDLSINFGEMVEGVSGYMLLAVSPAPFNSMNKEPNEPVYLSGVCCQYCIHFETNGCPISSASPWSRWGNWCNVYAPNPDEPEAKPLPFESEAIR